MSAMPSTPQHAASPTVDGQPQSTWRRLRDAGTARLCRAAGSSYLRGIATLSGGQFAAAVIPFLAAPILGRIYRPEDYAVLAIYMAIASVVSVFTTLQYQNAIIAERSERGARDVAALVIVISAIASFVLLGLIAALSAVVDLQAFIVVERPWLLTLPLIVFAMGTVAAATALANRHTRYQLMAAAQFASSLSGIVVSIVLGVLGVGSAALLFACVISQLVSLGMFANFLRGSGLRASDFRLSRLAVVARIYRYYPIYLLPTSMIDIGVNRLPVFLLTAQAAPALLGAYSRANQLVQLPALLLGGAVSNVYFQRAATDYQRLGYCWDIFKKTALTLAAIGCLPMLVLLLFGPQLFTLYLGPNWRTAGDVAQVLAPMLFIRLWVQPLNSVVLFSGNQWIALQTSILALGLVGGLCSLPLLYDLDPIYIIYAYALSNCILYLVQFAISFHLSRQRIPAVSQAAED